MIELLIGLAIGFYGYTRLTAFEKKKPAGAPSPSSREGQGCYCSAAPHDHQRHRALRRRPWFSAAVWYPGAHRTRGSSFQGACRCWATPLSDSGLLEAVLRARRHPWLRRRPADGRQSTLGCIRGSLFCFGAPLRVQPRHCGFCGPNTCLIRRPLMQISGLSICINCLERVHACR